jgi:hypothetical protein
MNMEVEQKWKGLSPSAFDKYVDKLSSEQYRSMCATDPEFFEAVNTTPDKRKTWGKDANYTIKKDSALGQFVAEEEHERTRPEREIQEQITDMVNKDLDAKYRKLRSRLDAGIGLDAQLCIWLDLPKNIPICPRPAAGFAEAGLAAMLKAARTFMSKHRAEGYFDDAEREVLYKTMSDACDVPGRMFDPRSDVSWEAVYKICLMAGRVRPQRTQPVEAPSTKKPELLVNLEKAQPTPEERRRFYMTQPVWTSKILGRTLTQFDIDRRLSADDFKTICNEGYTKEGRILTHTDQLRKGAR